MQDLGHIGLLHTRKHILATSLPIYAMRFAPNCLIMPFCCGISRVLRLYKMLGTEMNLPFISST